MGMDPPDRPPRPPPQWRVSLTSGATVVLSLTPVDMLYGVTVMAVLGSVASPFAVWSAFLPVILGNLFLARAAPDSAIFGGSRPAQTVMVTALMVAVTQDPLLSAGGLPVALAALVLAVSSAGLMQWLIGVFKLGRVIKFIPLPVLVGITNGSALALAWMALKDVLGVPALDGVWALVSQGDAGAALRLALLAGLLGLMFSAQLRGWRLHWSLVGLLVGSVLYQIAPLLVPALTPYGPDIGGTLPAAPDVDMSPQGLLGLANLSSTPAWSALLTLALPVGLALAAINTIETLIALAYLETLNGQRVEPNRVLRGLGMANLIGGLFGGLPTTPSNARILIGEQAGARNWRSPLAGAVTAMALIALLPMVVHLIPKLAASAVMIYLAWTLVDPWSRRGVRTVFDSQLATTLRRDLALMMGVTLMVLTLGVIPAIFLGLVVSMVIFVVNNSRSVIATMHRGHQRRSLVVRTAAEEEALAPLRARILLIELKGSLFFGTADAMRDAVEALLQPADVLILSLRRVAEIDASGARALARMANALKDLNVQVFLSDVAALTPPAREQLQSALHGVVEARRILVDADRALQAAEDYLLDGSAHELGDGAVEAPWTQSPLVRDMDSDELAVLDRYFTRQQFEKAQTIFSAGQAADALYLLIRGEVEISLPDQGNGAKRIGLFRSGVVFGEMGLLQASEPSADAVARSDVTVLTLGAEALAQVRHEHPDLGFKLMHNIARHLATRISIATAELRFALQI